MSLYIGPDNNEDKILHITKGETSAVQMKASLLSSTVFHSSLPYLQWEEYVGATSSEVYLDVTREDDYDFEPGNYLKVTAPNNFLSAIAGTTIKYFVTINDVIVQQSVAHATSMFPWFSSIVSRPIGGNDYPSISTPYTWMVSPGGGAYDIKFYTLNINTDGYVPISRPSTDILINDGIIINGVDLSTFRFLQSGNINNTDKTINVNGGLPLQLVNHTLPAGEMRLQSDTSGTSISVGDKDIFSTYHSIPKVKYNSTETKSVSFSHVEFNVSYKQWTTYTRTASLFSGFASGDMFVMEASDENQLVPGSLVGLSTIFTYKDGVIGATKLLPRYFSYKGVFLKWDLYTTLRGNNGTIYVDNVVRVYHSVVGLSRVAAYQVFQSFEIHRFS